MSNTEHKTPHTYVDAGKKLEDAASTAWSFTFLGLFGFGILILIWTGILPLNISYGTLLFGTIIIGILFLIFILVGIRAFFERNKLRSVKAEEDTSICQIRQWFQEYYSADAISNGMDEEDISIEQLYFLRSENIGRLLSEEFPELEESFAEYMIEDIYQMYFPD
ncbi:MAG: hypothetical protein HFI71_12160 [Lachnospiraceae bacterium]|nr:hypothetical protein [Lachnospiraceae bacterium]